MIPSPIATREDLERLGRRFETAVGTITRELSEHRRRLEDTDQKWHDSAVSLATRTRLWVAGIAALGVIIVGAMTSFSSHSYAVAREQMRETTRTELLAASSTQVAHDEMLIKQTLDARDQRNSNDVMTVRGAK